jgi:preprotein translocase subunit Sec63
MKKWNVQLIRVYETTAEVEVQAENEQDAIQLAEDVLSQDEESWSDYEKIDQHVESVKAI